MSKDWLISIVDDDRSFRESLKRLLDSFGYVAEVFASAIEFLGSASLNKTDCLIADINMPEMTGIELYKSLVDSGHTIPTILITAYPNEAIRSRALNEGIVGYLQKPCDEKDIVDCLRLALASRKPST